MTLNANDKISGKRLSSGSARSILLTLLGEFVWPEGGAVRTATLIHVMSGVGIAEKSARQAIARANLAGWIERNRVGRETYWTLTEGGRRIIEEGDQRVHALSQNSPWDGRWLVVVISLPDSYRSQRTKLYRALSWVGFGNPMPGIWVTPYIAREGETRRIIDELGLSGFSCAFAGPALRIGLTDQRLVEKSWDLQAVVEHYEMLLARFAKIRPHSDDEILFTHVQLMNEWQRVPFIDPGLPDGLLPPRWRGKAIASRLELLGAQWKDAAHDRWGEISGATAPL